MIISAAIKVQNANAAGGFTVIPCWRHHMGYAILHELRPDDKLHIGDEEGFINHRAYNHAIECGQIPAELRHIKAERHEETLFNEDLY